MLPHSLSFFSGFSDLPSVSFSGASSFFLFLFAVWRVLRRYLRRWLAAFLIATILWSLVCLLDVCNGFVLLAPPLAVILLWLLLPPLGFLLLLHARLEHFAHVVGILLVR